MKIALLGYGKMGKVIEKIALERGHEIVLKKDQSNSFDGLLNADIAIDFSIPDSAVSNITECLNNEIPVISGTTGWLNDYPKVVALCEEKNGSFIYGSNFSLGVNIFFELNEYLSKMMANLKQYNVSMEEIHHTQKLDAPSGTAITLAEGIIKHTDYTNWTLENPTKNQIEINAKRIENIPGTHSVFYDSEVDQIEIKHTAHSREGFALGAVVAAEWLVGKKGVFTMKDVLGI
ncbi:MULTISPECIES: 4-hydroxy-tetrahydrodipicolinate reductase [unclassified Flavobacterium]|uniref:4-hydroxy-tetrahydrodipicolinate reductase n=1 Tax=unclassified Flavobacterium TaxID=196869 RepID=UPI001292268D|nr:MULTISPECIES: 4-hydroxy-tetrahydrodipicolinate reductase [unclassified Flavobacterium]MQP53005.1 4-hydroxy-tetrahydrodipicolinate reductase [Flavobacterium sp. LMO9]MQP62826.1 4-hydroxy-tetrahydrodipicolinate reductase [Flavobacterium sp. LMO6]